MKDRDKTKEQPFNKLSELRLQAGKLKGSRKQCRVEEGKSILKQ